MCCGEEPVVLVGTRRDTAENSLQERSGPFIGTWEWEAGEMHIDGHDGCRKCWGPGRVLNWYRWR